MTLHLIKLCVGVDSIRELDEWIKERMAQKKKKKNRSSTFIRRA